MTCPICKAELSPGTFQVMENRRLVYRCASCDDFWGRFGLHSLKQPFVELAPKIVV